MHLSPNALVIVIQKHGIPAALDANGMIVVETSYAFRGQRIVESEIIEPTTEAVRAYLGY